MKPVFITLISLFLSTTLFAQAPTNGLVAYYPFSSNANDASGNNNNGTIYGNIIPVADRKGNTNSAYQFTDGSKIRVSNSSSLQFSKGFSYSAWVRLRSFEGNDGDTGSPSPFGYHVIFSKNCDRSWLFSMILSKSPGSINFSSGTWYGTWLSYFFDYTPNNWMHVAVAYDSTTTSMTKYINGKIVSASLAKLDFSYSNSADLIIGGMNCWSYYFNGDMDEIRFYNRALTEQEIKNTYIYEKAPIQSVKTGNWNDYTVWSCNCIPQASDVLQVNHPITVPVNNIAHAFQITYGSSGKIELGQGAKLLLNQ